MWKNNADVLNTLKDFQTKLKELEKQYNTPVELTINLFGGDRPGHGKDLPVMVCASVGEVIAFEDELGDLEDTLGAAIESIQVVLDHPEDYKS